MANMVAQVNAEMKRRGHAERLRRGKGYYYFCDGNSYAWPTASVYVWRASSLTVEWWLAQYDRLKADYERYN